jgi:hypothetical protein
MDNPCDTCTHAWSAGRNTTCADCCDTIKMYRSVIKMTRKPFLTEREYDNLNDAEQYYYIWCDNCKLYYTADGWKKHLCGVKKIVTDSLYGRIER